MTFFEYQTKTNQFIQYFGETTLHKVCWAT